MSALVTGGTGFIGGALVRALRADGLDVRVLVRPGTGARPLEALGAAVVRGDVADAVAVRAACEGCEVVYNLAVTPRVGRIAAMRAVNVTGARNVALAATACGARLVHASTAGVYGGALDAVPAGEDHPTRPERPYPLTKLEGERAIAEVAARAGASVALARIATVYGPGNVRGVGAYRAALARVTPLAGGGRQLIDLVHVDDIVTGLRACAGRRDPGVAVYNLAGGTPVPLRSVMEAIAAAAGRRLRPASLPRAPFLALEALNRHLLLSRGIDSRWQHRLMEAPRSRAFRISRAADELGYRPAVGLHDGVARTLAWYRDTGLIGPREGDGE